MLDENVPVLLRHMERDPDRLRQLERWKSILRERHTVATFTDAHDLAVRVAADLARTVQTIEQSDAARSQRTSMHTDLAEVLAEAEALGVSHERIVSMLRQSLRAAANSPEGRRPRIFLGHSHEDRSIVRQMADRLRSRAMDVWIDEAELKIGDSLVKSIEHGLDSSDFVVFFISRSSLRSGWTRSELDIALTRQISGVGGAILLPILLEDVELPPLLRTVAYLDLRDGDTERATRLLVEVVDHKFDRGGRLGERNQRIGRFRAYILITIQEAGVGEHLQGVLLHVPEVVEVTQTLGSVDLVAVLAANDLRRVNAIVKEIAKNPSVRSTTTLLGTA